jgi:hypothetical protein
MGTEVALDRRAEERHRAEVVPQVYRGDHVVAVRALRQAGRGVVERELHEPDPQSGSLRGLDRPAYPHRRGWCHDDGADRAMGGEQQRGVDGRDQVPLQHQRDEYEVRRSRAVAGVVSGFPSGGGGCFFSLASHPPRRPAGRPGRIASWLW